MYKFISHVVTFHFQLDTFFVLESGTICSDFNRRILNDVKSCRSAVPKLKYFDPRTNFEKVESRSDWPSGCYITNGGVYFNNHSTGNRNPMANHICRTGILHQLSVEK